MRLTEHNKNACIFTMEYREKKDRVLFTACLESISASMAEKRSGIEQMCQLNLDISLIYAYEPSGFASLVEQVSTLQSKDPCASCA